MGMASKREGEGSGAVASALEEHGLLRHFMGVVRALSRGEEDSRQDLLDACDAAIRYFTDSFPLLVVEEENAIAARLEGRDAALDEAIRAMRAEHAALVPAIRSLVESLAQVRAEPEAAEHREGLRRLVMALSEELERHLQAEERTVFAAVSERVPASVSEQILAELRARRGD
jgi:hemerythrin-like domain-containing protein